MNGRVYFGLPIPDADSLLVGFSPHTRIIGLDSVASADRPPALTLIHLSFDAMVGLAFLLLRVRPHAHVPGSDDNGGVIDSLTAIVVYVVLGVANLILLRMLARRRRLPANRAGDPFFMGTVIGAIASGRVPANPGAQ